MKMGMKLIAWTIAATLLITPMVSGCKKKKEEPKPKTLYGIRTKDWGVVAKEKGGNKSIEGWHKDGYRIKVEEKEDGSLGVKIRIPETYSGHLKNY